MFLYSSTVHLIDTMFEGPITQLIMCPWKQQPRESHLSDGFGGTVKNRGREGPRNVPRGLSQRTPDGLAHKSLSCDHLNANASQNWGDENDSFACQWPTWPCPHYNKHLLHISEPGRLLQKKLRQTWNIKHNTDCGASACPILEFSKPQQMGEPLNIASARLKWNFM